MWTHASKPQIRSTLDSFLRDANEDGVFLTTYLPSGWGRPDYQGDQWFGTSHESDVPGLIYHSRRWIRAECAARGLAARKLGRDRTHFFPWLEIKRRVLGKR